MIQRAGDAVTGSGGVAAVAKENLLLRARDLRDDLGRWRRHLHAHPELSGQETETAAYIAAELGAMGLAPRLPQPNAVVAEIGADPDGPTIALRADIDALPIAEETGLPFSSRRPGVMHACGHDGHAAVLLGVARILTARADRLRGRARLIFQPAEEVPPGGARELISAGVLGGVSAVIGLHLWCPLPTGKAIVVSGPAWAAADRFRAVIHGRGGHGAKPQEAVDALEAACRCVVALQSIVSRAINPLDAAVVTVGTLHAGEAFNIVADAAVLEGTVRAFDEDVRRLIKGRIAEVLAHTAAAAGARAELDYVDGYPVLRNDAKVAEVMRQAAGRYLGEKAVGDGPREMAADDFARYAECVPGCYMSLGATAAGNPGYPNHHPHFTLDEDALPVGAAILAETALHLMQRRA